MANIFKDTQLLERPSAEKQIKLYEQAEFFRDWESLKPYPRLLWYWQCRHVEDIQAISYWISHFRRLHQSCKLRCNDSSYIPGSLSFSETSYELLGLLLEDKIKPEIIEKQLELL